MKLLCAVLLGSVVAGAQTVPSVSHAFSQPCNAVHPAALAYFKDRGMPLLPSSACGECLQGSTKHLHDASGHRLFSNRKVIEQSTTKDLQYEKVGPVQQIVHWDLRVGATLQLTAASQGCQASLRFQYSWYGAALILGFPVDGDPSSAPSNGRLEAAYLDALQQRLEHASVARR